MADGVTITPTADGPHMIGGAMTIQWPSGHTIALEEEFDENGYIYLCRCGHSNNKPFCDNSHKRVGFKSTEGDATAHKE